MINKFKAALAATAIAAAFGATAPASATVYAGFGPGLSVADLPSLGYTGFTLLNDFSVDAGVTGDYMIHGDVSDGNGAVPAYGSAGNFLSVLGTKEAYITLPGNVVAFAFDWGSMDAYNTINFTCTGGDCGAGFDFDLIPGTYPLDTFGSNGDQHASSTNGVLLVYGDAGETFGTLTLKSGSNSLEIDNLSILKGAVPEPTTWAMMIGGLALVGVQMRRRKTIVSFA